MTRCTLHGFVGAVLLLGRRNILVPTNFASQSHAFPADEVGHRVVEAVGFDGIPCSKEDNIAHEDLVFECGSEVTFWFAEGFLDLAPNSGDGFDGCAFKFGDFDCGGEHVFDESCILEDFVGVPVSLSFLTISVASSTFRTVPVAAIRKPGFFEEKVW